MPAPTITDNDTTLTDGTEQTLFTTTTNAYYGGGVDLSNMASGDQIEIKLYKGYKSAGALVLVDTYPFTDAQAKPGFEIPMLHAPYGYKLTIKRLAGTDRNYDWYVVNQ